MPKYTNHEILTKLIEDTDWYHINSNGELALGATSDNALYKASDILTIIRDVSTTDVEPVKHGKWLKETRPKKSDDGFFYWNITPKIVYVCSECGREEKEKEPYCNCGAKMDGGIKNGTL